MSTNQQKPRKNGRPAVLDEAKRRIVLTILRAGASRRLAAKAAGVAPSTITRTARRDPPFAAELAEAEFEVQRIAIDAVRRAARDPKYWRAAAWILERKDPDAFSSATIRANAKQQMHKMVDAAVAKAVEKLLDSSTGQALPSMVAEAVEASLRGQGAAKPAEGSVDAAPADGGTAQAAATETAGVQPANAACSSRPTVATAAVPSNGTAESSEPLPPPVYRTSNRQPTMKEVLQHAARNGGRIEMPPFAPNDVGVMLSELKEHKKRLAKV